MSGSSAEGGDLGEIRRIPVAGEEVPHCQLVGVELKDADDIRICRIVAEVVRKMMRIGCGTRLHMLFPHLLQLGAAARLGFVTDEKGVRQGLHFIECRPMVFPSVSPTMAMKPYSPMANFSLMTLPPLAVTRAVSTAQSSQEK